MKVLNVSMILALTLLVSCGGSKGGGSKSKNGSNLDGLKGSEKDSFTTTCLKTVDEEDGEVTYGKIIMNTTHNASTGEYNVITKTQLYDDANCRSPEFIYTVSGTGFEFRPDSILVSYNKVEWTLYNQVDVEELNEVRMCGLSWKKGKANDITHTECVEKLSTVEIVKQDEDSFLVCEGGRESGDCMLLKRANNT